MHDHDQYRIAFSGLKPGSYAYDFRAGKSFFEQAEDTGIVDGNVAVELTMLREERMLDLHFSLNGTVTVPCDRCNEPVEMRIEGRERLIVKFGDRFYEESESVQVIPESDSQFDVGPFLYEYIRLLLPARRVHPGDANGTVQCDPEVLKKLEELGGHPAADPRWEALNKLKKNKS